MALSQYLLHDIFDDFALPRALYSGNLFDQNFGLGILHDDLVPLASHCAGYIRPWRHQTARNSGVSNVQDNQDGFKVNLDVQQFKPDEINVKIVDDYVVVEGTHEERQDEHGYISRQFQRRYKLPEDVNPDALVSKLSSDGVLSIKAPKKTIESPSKERVIQIVHTNAPAVKSAPLNSKEESKAKDSEDKMDQ